MTIAVDPPLADQGLYHRPSGRWWIAQHTPRPGPARYTSGYTRTGTSSIRLTSALEEPPGAMVTP